MQKPISVHETTYERMSKMRSVSLRSFTEIINHLMEENQRLTIENQKLLEGDKSEQGEEIQKLRIENQKLLKDLETIKSAIGKY
jgi:predicted CopG family antitoxin